MKATFEIFKAAFNSVVDDNYQGMSQYTAIELVALNSPVGIERANTDSQWWILRQAVSRRGKL